MLAKLRSAIELYRRYRDEESIIIFQMGKVGSVALEQAIPNALQVHSLYADLPPARFRERNMPWLRRTTFRLSRLIQRAAIRARSRVRIITVVRHPVARNRSMFFQDLELWLATHYLATGADKNAYGLDALVDAYVRSFDHDYFETWFDAEFRRLTGIDLLAGPTHGSAVRIQRGRYDILVLRAEDFAGDIDAISAFCGRPIVLGRHNDSSQKWYAPLYAEFAALPPTAAEERVLAGRGSRHFGY